MPPPPPPSPAPSSTLLPFLGSSGPRERRGSLASLKSVKGSEIDKEVLAQALDDIHGAASKSDTLTSFHDYDGGEPKAGAKEIVSNGVSGFMDKLKRGMGGGSAVKGDVRDKEALWKPKPSTSRESVETESVKSNVSGGKGLRLIGQTLQGDTASVVSNAATSSRVASPDGTPTSKARFGTSREKVAYGQDSTAKTGARLSSQVRDEGTSEHQYPDELKRTRTVQLDDDMSTSASDALARALSGQDLGPSAPTHRLTIDSDNGLTNKMIPPTPHISFNTAPTPAVATLSTANVSRLRDDGTARPPLLRIGASHLPGYQPSRTSSTDGGDSSSQATAHRTSILDPSPNINTALQRRRTDMRPPPHPSTYHPSNSVAIPDRVPTHLRRRVISKAFWMKDENAKDCFYCGQPFSTFRRKHHCRTCGQIFDARCTSLVPGRPFGQPGTIRLCKPCEAMICGSDDDSTVWSDDGMSVFDRSPLVGRRSFGSEMDDLRGKMDGINDDGDGDFGEVATPSIGIPASRRNRESKRRSAVIEFDAGPMMPRPASSHSLMSMARRPRSSSHRRFNSRHQGLRGMRTPGEERVPFQPGSIDEHERKPSLPAFHNDNIIDPDLAAFLSDDGSDDEGDHQSIFATLGGDGPHLSSLGERDRSGYAGFLSSSTKKGRSRHGTASGIRLSKEEDALIQATKHLPKLSRNRNPSIGSVTFNRSSPRRTRSQHLLRPLVDPESFERKAVSPLAGFITTNAPPSSGAATRIMRSGEMINSAAPSIELNSASLKHLQNLLAQLLRDHSIPHPRAWQKALVPIILQCTTDVDPNVQFGDDMDIRHYIKLKKVPGGRPGDTSYVSGVVFSKNVALKSMVRNISYPRIAIVTFAIEYARHGKHFMSLEPVIAQEAEYLKNLVGRIKALGPSVLLVQRNVSGLALDLLEKAGIAVAYNIKESVLAAVARVTSTTMIKSVDKLAIDPAHLGTCESFELKTFMHERARKTYIFLTGCQPDLGCTIVLRGADTTVLRRVKRVTEFMCYVAYSLKLETNLLRDEFVSVPTQASGGMEAADISQKDSKSSAAPHVGLGMDHGESLLHANMRATTNNPPSRYEVMEMDCQSRILSASPFVVFMQPYILTQLRDSERRLATYEQLRDQYAEADEEGDEDEKNDNEQFEIVRPEMVHVPPSKRQPKAVREYLHAVHQVQYDKTLHTYETQRRLMDAFTNGASDPFDPFSHQTIIMLHSIVSTINSAPCTGPDQLGIGFYAGYNHVIPNFEEDCTLGQYVEDVCMTAGTKCKECGKKMYDHHRQYVHGHGQLSISVSRQSAKLRGYEKTILMWAACRICKAETTVLPMSEGTWKYSFAKYLELSFWSSPLRPRAGVCGHDVHKDFLRYFGFEDLAVRVQFDKVEIYDVVVPRATVTWKVESDLKVKNEQFSHFVGRLNAFTESIKKRLDSINVDTLDEKMSIEANDYLDVLRERAQVEHAELLEKLQLKYAGSRYYELIPLNRALRFMDEKALMWDSVFEAFERDYFPSEADIRKLATLQLKNMFLESQPAPSTVASEVSDDEDDLEETPPMSHAEKAHDVLTSTVEEHRASISEVGDVAAVIKKESEDQLGSSLARNVSPREEQEQVVQREEVKHLDLAIPIDALEESAAANLTKDESPTSRPTTQDSQVNEEPFATQTKPMASGLLERIEQIRNNRGVLVTAEQESESRIPRLVDRKKRDGSTHLSSAPPLLRAQSSPSSPHHTPHRSIDLDTGNNVDVAKSNATPPDNSHHLERRLAEKFGMSRLANKVSKVAPSLIPRSVPKDDAVSSSVSALAKHFEEMSREFEKERLKDRKQRALRSRQARANPLASSQPVVEVYRNATDAVGERSVDAAKTEQLMKGLKVDRLLVGDRTPVVQPVSSDDLPDELAAPNQDDAEGVTTGDEVDKSDTDAADREGGDQEAPPILVHDTSDPSSTVASSVLLSPTSLMMPDIELSPELSIPEHRKNVWFNYLAEFWSKRSASGWAPLEYPLHATEHVFEDSDIIVREDEPSSVIALSLACVDYQTKVQQFRSHPKKHSKQTSAATNSFDAASVGEETQQQAIEASLLSDTGTHMKYSFAHGAVKASCKIFYAESFDALRRRCGVADRFVESMSRCLKYDSKGGKTKSLFLKTLDDRFIIKSLQEVELKAFTKFAPDYFAFMSHTLFHGVPSVIAKMFGLFQVSIKNPASGMEFSYYLLVMENLFYERNPNRRFDLKGSMRNRKIESTGQPDEVLLDENLVETIFESPLFVREHARKLLQASVYNDTMWLCKQNVMDYSLMAGFDDERKELIVGIIDCIRTYTWDKKLESWIKDRGKNKPTITSPKDYRNRFRVSMMQYVLQAPNCWHQFQAQMAPPKTLKEKEDVAETTETEKEAESRRSEG